MKHQPATPLPWELSANAAHNGDRWVSSDSLTVVRVEDAADAAYIAHVANAYPKLVEALRDLIERKKVARVANAENLLRELGEAS